MIVTLDDMLLQAEARQVLENLELERSGSLDDLACIVARNTARPLASIFLYRDADVSCVGSNYDTPSILNRTFYGPVLHKDIVQFDDVASAYPDSASLRSGPAPIRAFSFVPLLVCEEPVGIFASFSRDYLRPLDMKQQQFLKVSARMASTLLETKARLKTTLMNVYGMVHE